MLRGEIVKGSVLEIVTFGKNYVKIYHVVINLYGSTTL
jgi:hypothetical protein